MHSHGFGFDEGFWFSAITLGLRTIRIGLANHNRVIELMSVVCRNSTGPYHPPDQPDIGWPSGIYGMASRAGAVTHTNLWLCFF